MCIPSNGLFYSCCSVPCFTLLLFVCMCCHPYFSAHIPQLSLPQVWLMRTYPSALCSSHCRSYQSTMGLSFITLTSVVILYSYVHLWEFCFSYLSMSYMNVGISICLVIFGIPRAHHSATKHSMFVCLLNYWMNKSEMISSPLHSRQSAGVYQIALSCQWNRKRGWQSQETSHRMKLIAGVQKEKKW